MAALPESARHFSSFFQTRRIKSGRTQPHRVCILRMFTASLHVYSTGRMHAICLCIFLRHTHKNAYPSLRVPIMHTSRFFCALDIILEATNPREEAKQNSYILCLSARYTLSPRTEQPDGASAKAACRCMVHRITDKVCVICDPSAGDLKNRRKSLCHDFSSGLVELGYVVVRV